MANKIPIGERRWLWSGFAGTPNNHAPVLVISAHGAQAGQTFKVPTGNSLIFYAPENDALIDPDLENVVYNKVIAKEAFDPGTVSPDYTLTKYQGKKHGSESESYAEISRLVDKQPERDRLSPGRGTDVLTIRSRMPWACKTAQATLGNTLTLLHKMGYRYGQIRCSFCRSTTQLFDGRSFQPAQMKDYGTTAPVRKNRFGRVRPLY